MYKKHSKTRKNKKKLVKTNKNQNSLVFSIFSKETWFFQKKKPPTLVLKRCTCSYFYGARQESRKYTSQS